MKRLYLRYVVGMVCLTVFTTTSTFSQSQDEIKSSQSIENLIKRADQMYEFGDKPDAMSLYSEALKRDSNNIRANFMYGVCHLELMHKRGGLEYLLKAYEADNNYDPEILYYIAESYHYGHQFEEAIEYYKMYKSKLKKQLKKKVVKKHEYEEKVHRLKRKIEESHNGVELLKKPIDVQIIDLGENINSEYPDYTPAVTSSENVMIYTSRRHGSTGNLLHADKLHYEDIYISKKNKDGHWMKSENIGLTINTVSHDAVISISPKGDELFIYKDKGGGDIYESKQNFKGEWSEPVPLKAINTKDVENHITESADESYFVFSSNRKGGFGGLDLYLITRDKKGKWSEPINLGSSVNSAYDEDSPFLDKNGDLYFSSRGHKGIGGFDIFKSFKNEKNGKWSHPENIGYPINSADDDMYFILPGSGNIGYYSSYKSTTYGGKDIYKIEMQQGDRVIKGNNRQVYLQIHDLTIDKPQAVESTRHEITIIHGFMTDVETKEPIHGRVSVMDSITGEVITETMSDSVSGEYSLLVSSGKTYAISIEKGKYMYSYDYVHLPENVNHDHEEYQEDVSLKHLTVGATAVLERIYFDFDRATLKEESYPELQRFAKVMKQFPTFKVEISGHTDNMGQEEYNKMLSQWRAQAVVDYLVNDGIDESRFTSKGYGMDKPITTNETFFGRQTNRRIEIQIVEQ